jgi:hypothetical protein
MNALQVVRTVIENHRLHDATFTLVSHDANTEWREITRLHRPRPAGIQVPGRLLLSLDDLDRYRNAEQEVVSISSRFDAPRPERHLALMDLLMDDSIPLPFLSDLVRGYCNDRNRWLLQTGRGYHVYGDFLLREDEWWQWNDRFLALPELANLHYVHQSLRWGGNLLRTVAGPAPWASAPTTVDDDHASAIVTGARRLAHARHAYQLGRNREPLVRHLNEVATLARHIYLECLSPAGAELADSSSEELYACGYLHACLDDTATDYEDLLDAAGEQVAEWVAQVSRDKRLPSKDRRAAYEDQLRHASPAARIVKLADLLSQLRGLARWSGRGWTIGQLLSVGRQLDLIGDGLEACAEFVEARRLVREWRARLVQPER